MRLLTYDENNCLVLKTFDTDELPAYAILSHTWHVDNEQEVTFQDLETGRAESKKGYEKLRFCGKKASADGLRYFWVDTCCINKMSDPELSEAINSMFRWYERANRCYVYLADVSGGHRTIWEPALRQSRWFTRGWTLQELLAPRVVEFYSNDGERLGDKSSLGQLIYEVTAIRREALRNDHLSDYGFEEKMGWAQGRSTKRSEDAIHSMLGIFTVSIPLIYGEGRNNALRRLRNVLQDAHSAPGPNEFVISRDLSRFPKAAKFVARGKELQEIETMLHRPQCRNVVVLHGLGGIGKTQLSVAHVDRHKARYSAVFWVDANTIDLIHTSFMDIVRQILRDQPSTPALADLDTKAEAAQIVAAVLRSLSMPKNTGWLLIFNNCDNPQVPGHADAGTVDLRRYLPKSDHGSILITTRSAEVSLGHRLHIKKLVDVQEGMEILLNTSQRHDNQDGAMELVEELDGLPLALATAGAYLRQVSTSFAEYLRMYKTSWTELQQSTPQLDSYDNRSLHTTWQLSLDRLRRQDEDASMLLKLWAYFDRQDVWYELLHGGSLWEAKYDGVSESNGLCDWLVRVTATRARFDKAMRLLCSYGLVNADVATPHTVGSTGYSMHSCVHAWTKLVLNDEGGEKLTRSALHCVAYAVPQTEDADWWLIDRRLLRHATQSYHAVISRAQWFGQLQITLHAIYVLVGLYVRQYVVNEAEAMCTAILLPDELSGVKDISAKHFPLSICLADVYVNQG